MYIPEKFRNNDADAAKTLIEENPFATIITVANYEPFVSHLPLISQNLSKNSFKLVGHMARTNRHWQLMQSQPTTKIIFHGPHCYITPTWYTENDVPTWNYAVVHIEGTARLLEDATSVQNCVKLLASVMEKSSPSPWDFWIPEDLQGDNLTEAIVGFEIEVTKVSAKYKLNQNRSKLDRQGVIAGLATRSDEPSHKIRELMLQQEKKAAT